MAKAQEIIQIEQIYKGLTDVDGIVNKLSDSYLRLVKTIDDGSQPIKNNAISLENLAKAQKQTADEGKKLDALGKQLVASETKLKQVEDSRLKTIVQNKVATQEATKAIKDKIQADKAEIGSIDQLRARNKELTTLRNGTTASTEKGRQAIAKYNAELNRNNSVIKSNSDGLTKQKIGIGGYMKSMIAATGIMVSSAIIFRAFFNVIKNGFKTSIEFEYAMSQVKAITRGTSEEFATLRDNAIKMGSATKFTAIEVAGLQKEYAKLGFSVVEIVNITRATLDLAAATGTDLAFAATIAGQTMRQFGMDATQMGQITDVMTKSFSTSALDMDKFSTAMEKAGPVARAVGDTLEDTTAKLAMLANSGIDASTSGTSLRNIYLRLEAAGLSWNDAMDKIQGSQNKARTSLELFGVRGATAGLILADNTEGINDYVTSLKDADGTTKEMAATMLDNLKGATTIMKSQWEALTLRINESNGALKKFITNLGVMISGIATEGIKDMDELFDDKKIQSFNDRFQFFVAMGVGYQKAGKMARKNSNEETQKLKDEFVQIGIDYKAEMDKVTAIRLKQEADEKEAKDKKLKAIQIEVDAEVKAAKDKEQAVKDSLKIEELLSKDSYEKQKTYLKDKLDYDLSEIDITDLQKQIKRIEYHQAIAEIDKKVAKEDLELKALMEQYTDKYFENEKKRNQELLSDKERLEQYADEYFDKEKKRNDKKKELAKELRDTQIEFALEAFNTLFSINESANNKKLDQLNKQKEAELNNDKLTKDQRAKIEEEYAKKEAAIQKKQKIANKLESAIEVGIKTAKTIFELQATAAILLSNPLTMALAPMALAQIPWVLGMSALSLAAIAKYKTGTMDAKDKFIAGESGRELIFLRSGDVALAEKPTYFEGSKFKGSRILSNPKTEKLIKMSDQKIEGYQITDERLLNKMDEVKNEMTSVRKAIQSKPVAIFDKENRQIGHATSHSQTIYLNRLTRSN